MTGAELVAAYLIDLERRGRSPSTLRAAAYRLKPFLAAVPDQPTEWCEEHLAGLRRLLLARNRSESFVFVHLLAARNLVRWAYRRGFLLVDWTRDLVLRTPVHPVRQVPTVEQMAACLAVLDPSTPVGLRDLTILEMLYGTGLRRSELLALDLTDVDLAERFLRVQRAKRGGEQLQPIGEHLAEVLERYLHESRPRFRLPRGLGALFVTLGGQRLQESRLQNLLLRISRAAGLPFRLGSHRIRHAYATHLLQGGAPSWAVQALLGHRRPDSLQVYTHVTLEDLRRELSRTHPRWRRRRRRA